MRGQLRELAPDLPIIPVVQGQHPEQYLYCVDLYRTLAMVDLTTEPLVGVGSVCRRQGTDEAGQIHRIFELARELKCGCSQPGVRPARYSQATAMHESDF